jgi:hypothetical protein
MKFDFENEMKKLNDESLLKVLTIEKDNYQPEALAAAKTEFEKRGLPANKINFITQDLNSQKAEDDKKAIEPLDDGLKILTLLFPMIITFFLSGFYKSKGYDRKAGQLGNWTLLGFGLYIAVTIIIALL